MNIKTFAELTPEEKIAIFQLEDRLPFKLRKIFPDMQKRFEEKLELISPEFYLYYILEIKDAER